MTTVTGMKGFYMCFKQDFIVLKVKIVSEFHFYIYVCIIYYLIDDT